MAMKNRDILLIIKAQNKASAALKAVGADLRSIGQAAKAAAAAVGGQSGGFGGAEGALRRLTAASGAAKDAMTQLAAAARTLTLTDQAKGLRSLASALNSISKAAPNLPAAVAAAVSGLTQLNAAAQPLTLATPAKGVRDLASGLRALVKAAPSLPQTFQAITDGINRMGAAANNSAGLRAMLSNLRAASPALRALGTSLTQIQSQLSRLGNGSQFGGIRTQALGAQSAVLGLNVALAGLGGALGARNIIETADAWTVYTSRLRVVSDTQAQAEAASDRLFDLAIKTRSPLQSLGLLYERVSRQTQQYGLAQEDVYKLVEAVGLATSITGGSTQQLNAAVVQFTQALGNNFTAAAQELNSINEQAPRLAQAIAAGLRLPPDALGQPVEVLQSQLKKLGKDGRLSTEAVIKSIISQLGVLRGEFSLFPATVGQSFTVMGTYWQQFIGQIDKATGTTTAFGARIRELGERLQDPAVVAAGAKAMGVFGDALVGAGNAAIWMAKNIDAVVLAAQALVAVKVAGWTAALVEGAKAAAVGVRALTAALLTNPIGLIATAVVSAGVALYAFRDSMITVGDSTARLGTIAAVVWSDIIKGATAVWQWIGTMADGIANGLAGAWQSVQSAAGGSMSGVVRFVRGGVDLIARMWKGFANFLLNFWLGLPEIIRTVAVAAGQIWNTTLNSLTAKFSKLGDLIGSLMRADWSGAGRAAGEVFSTGIETGVVDAGLAAGAALHGVFSTDRVGQFVEVVKGALDTTVAYAGDATRRAAEAAAQEAANAPVVVPTTIDPAPTGPYGVVGAGKGDERAEKRFESRLDRLLQTLAPAIDRVRDYHKAVETLNEAEKTGAITAEQKILLLRRASEEYGAMAGPLGQQLTAMREEAHLLTVARPQREFESRWMQLMNDVRRDGTVLTKAQTAALREQMRVLNQAQTDDTFRQSLDERIQAMHDEIAVLGLVGRERERQEAILAFQREAEKAGISDAAAAVREFTGEYDRLAAAKIAADRALNTPSEGIKRAVNDYVVAARDAAGNMQQVMGNALTSIEDYFVEMASTGKASFSGLVQSILADLTRLAVKKTLSGVYDSLFGVPEDAQQGGLASSAGGLGGLLDRLFGNGRQEGVKAPEVQKWTPVAFAPGQVMTVNVASLPPQVTAALSSMPQTVGAASGGTPLASIFGAKATGRAATPPAPGGMGDLPTAAQIDYLKGFGTQNSAAIDKALASVNGGIANDPIIAQVAPALQANTTAVTTLPPSLDALNGAINQLAAVMPSAANLASDPAFASAVGGAVSGAANIDVVKVAETATPVANQFATSMQAANDNLVGGLDGLFSGFTGQLGGIFNGLLGGFGSVAQSLIGGLGGVISGLLGGGGGGGGNIGSIISGIGSIVGMFHGGGVVGDPRAAVTAVSPRVFDAARRLHGGGIAGRIGALRNLKPNEVPAILERDERVLTEEDQRALRAGSVGGLDARAASSVGRLTPAATGGGSYSNTVYEGDSVAINMSFNGGGARPSDPMRRSLGNAANEAAAALARYKRRNG
ncbi:hypothetical protein [Azospirillum argentinense]|uniref:tape measure protein n=1 Tax=Azospirillum argentinense TaxID=2970906 RepID=UPI0032E0032A